MKPVLVLFASEEGQTQRIAEHVGDYLFTRRVEARVEDVEEDREPIDSNHYRAVVLVASVQLGVHAHEMIRFVKKHRHELESIPIAFLSVSLVAGSAEDPRQNGPHHPRTSAEVRQATRDFLERTGLRPKGILPVAGALLYTQDGRLVRFAMQQIAPEIEVHTAASRAFEDAPWAPLERYVDDFLKLRPCTPVPSMVAAHT